MKPNDIYINTADRFNDLDEIPRTVIIRDIKGDKVTFSVPMDEQPRIGEGIIEFEPSTFTVNRAAFEMVCKPWSPLPCGIGRTNQ